MYKRPKNNFNFDKNGERRPGYNSQIVKIERPKDSPTENDSQNRANVLKQIEDGLSAGKSMDEILDVLCDNEEINKQFNYLKIHGLDLRKIFASWYESKQKNKNVKGNIFIKD